MGNLISLEGATVTVPANWTATAGYGKFSINGKVLLPHDTDFVGIWIGANIYGSNTDNRITFVSPLYEDMGSPANSNIDNTNAISFNVTGGTDVTNQNLIQWLVNNNATITGVYEEEKTNITYNKTTTPLEVGKTATLKCNGKKMLSDVVVSGKCNITYNGNTTSLEAGKTATLKCNGKKMLSDVVVKTFVAITDLTGKTIVFNDAVNNSESKTYAINFTIGSETFTELRIISGQNITYANGSNVAPVYENGLWVEDKYKTIQVSGGTDATNSEFIAKIQAIASIY